MTTTRLSQSKHTGDSRGRVEVRAGSGLVRVDSGGAWVWWGMFSAAALITVVALVYAVRSSMSDARDDEADPGGSPARDIDRSSPR